MFTAILVTQTSIGGSVKAAGDWVISTLGGGAYAAIVGTLIPKDDPVTVGIGLALVLAPLALLAGLRQTFRFAPVTGGIVILVAPVQHLSALNSAANRLLEIGVGGFIGLAVSLFVLPARAQVHVGGTAARILRVFAELMPLLARFDRVSDMPKITALHDAALMEISRLTAAVEEARRERSSFLSNDPDPDPVLRTVQRLRADMIMIGRAIAEPLPEPVQSRLSPALVAVTQTFAAGFRANADSLEERRAAPSLDAVEAAIAAYARELASLREEQLTRGLSTDAVGRIFAVGFALEQCKGNLRDLSSRINERARKPVRPELRAG